jgi:hypothetical protein
MPVRPGQGRGESRDAYGVVAGAEGIVAQHDVEPGHGFVLGGVGSEPRGIPHNVESGVDGLPLRG